MIKVLVFFLSVVFFHAQSKYDVGYLEGHEKGFCYAASEEGEVYCQYPYVKFIPPVPRTFESSYSYSDGYNRGYAEGLKSYRETLKKTPPSSRVQTYKNYKQLSIGNLGNAATIIQGQRDSNVREVFNVVSAIIADIENQNIEAQQKELIVETFYSDVQKNLNNNKSLDYSSASQTNEIIRWLYSRADTILRNVISNASFQKNYKAAPSFEESRQKYLEIVTSFDEQINNFDTKIKVSENNAVPYLYRFYQSYLSEKSKYSDLADEYRKYPPYDYVLDSKRSDLIEKMRLQIKELERICKLFNDKVKEFQVNTNKTPLQGKYYTEKISEYEIQEGNRKQLTKVVEGKSYINSFIGLPIDVGIINCENPSAPISIVTFQRSDKPILEHSIGLAIMDRGDSTSDSYRFFTSFATSIYFRIKEKRLVFHELDLDKGTEKFYEYNNLQKID